MRGPNPERRTILENIVGHHKEIGITAGRENYRQGDGWIERNSLEVETKRYQEKMGES